MSLWPSPSPALLGMLGVMLAGLTVGSLVRLVAVRRSDPDTRRQRLQSLGTWWVLALILSAALAAGLWGMCILLAALSWIALREFSTVTGLREADPGAVRVSCIIALVHYAIVLTGNAQAFTVFVPVAGIMILACLPLLRDDPRNYVRSTGGLFWGVVVLVYGLSHAVYPFLHEQFRAAPAGAAGWCLYLIVLTETNDIAQALVGRRFGAHKRHRIAPVVSPQKTWEGFIGGMLVTTGLAVVLAPWLTTLAAVRWEPAGLDGAAWLAPAVSGVLISIAGFIGDVNLSAVKRDARVKDSSRLLPGMGGVLDRIDSLTFTAPVFVYFASWVA